MFNQSIVLFFLFSNLVYLGPNYANAEASISANPSYFILFGYQLKSTKINHNETSNMNTFKALNTQDSITKNSLEMGIGKEFLSESLFSFTPSAHIGYNLGSEEDSLIHQNLKYKDKLSGQSYKISGSINWNIAKEALD